MDTLVVLADSHCGSYYGLRHERHFSESTPAPVKWLWDRWVELKKALPKKVDLLVLNGDLIDGKQSKSEGTGLYTTSMGEQATLAMEVYAPMIAKAKKVLRIAGTSYHEGFNGALDAFDQHFDIPQVDTNRLIMRDIRLDDNVVLNVKHQPDGGFAIYRGTVMDRELLWKSIAETVHTQPQADILIRSHLHSTNFFGGFRKQIHLTPCFCLQQPYARMKQSSRWIPDIGGTVIRRDPKSTLGWNIQHIVYPVPVPDAELFQ